MKRNFLILTSLFICVLLAGCAGWTMRTSVSEKPRVDQEVSGNRGFITGQAATDPEKPSFTTRKVYKLEIEVPPFSSKAKAESARKESAQPRPRKDTEVWGNKGYLSGSPAPESVQEKPSAWKFDAMPVEELDYDEPMTAKAEKKVVLQTYKVRKGDTLQKISQKFYGTTKKWSALFEANKDRLKSPDKVYPGQLLNIPAVAGYRK